MLDLRTPHPVVLSPFLRQIINRADRLLRNLLIAMDGLAWPASCITASELRNREVRNDPQL